MKNNGKATVWFAVGFVVIATIIIIVAAVVSAGSLDGTPSSDTPAPEITAEDWSQGPKDAKVTLIEYGDFQCPACATYHPMVKKVLGDYGDRVLFVFRNFPLYTIHPNAGIGSQAAEAASLQGKYWEMYDLLYTKQNEWSSEATNRVAESRFEGYAASLGMDVEKFRKDINSDQVLKKIQRDVDGGNDIGVGKTPTFYLNLKQIQSPASEAEFRSILDAALASS